MLDGKVCIFKKRERGSARYRVHSSLTLRTYDGFFRNQDFSKLYHFLPRLAAEWLDARRREGRAGRARRREGEAPAEPDRDRT